MTFRADDLDKMNEVLEDRLWDDALFDSTVDCDGLTFGELDEANYGWSDELDKLAEARVDFLVPRSHGSLLWLLPAYRARQTSRS